MTRFVLFLDDVGAEFTNARATYKVIYAANPRVPAKMRPIGIEPIEVLDEKLAKRAAGGFILLGPLGAALGVALGKGPKVLFELQSKDGTIRRGVIHQRDYSLLRRKVESMAKYEPRSVVIKSDRLSEAQTDHRFPVVPIAFSALVTIVALGVPGMVLVVLAGIIFLIVNGVRDFRAIEAE